MFFRPYSQLQKVEMDKRRNRSISGDTFTDLILENPNFITAEKSGILKMGSSQIQEKDLLLHLQGIGGRSTIITSEGEILFRDSENSILNKRFNHTPTRKNIPTYLNSKQIVIPQVQQNIKYIIFDQFQGRYFMILEYLGKVDITDSTLKEDVIMSTTYMIQTGTKAFAEFFKSNRTVGTDVIVSICRDINRLLPLEYVRVNDYNLCSCVNRENDYEGGVEDGVDRDQFCMIGFLGEERSEYKEKLNTSFYSPLTSYCPCVNNLCELARGINPTASLIEQNQCDISLNLTVCNVNIEVDEFTTNNFNIEQNCGGSGEGNCPFVDGQLCSGRGICTNNECVCQGYIGDKCQFQVIDCGINGYQSSDTGKCVCTNGFTGDACEFPPPDQCQDVVCQNGGVCGNGKCVCTNGFTGDACEFPPPDQCQDVACQNGGVCGNGKCVCTNGFTGDTCEFPPPDQCQDVVCPEGSICENGECKVDETDETDDDNGLKWWFWVIIALIIIGGMVGGGYYFFKKK